MSKGNLGILHPGEMGISVAVSAQNSGHPVYWTSQGRSPQTRQRAEQHHLLETPSLEALCKTCEILVSVCPPDAAEEVAQAVLSHGFRGLYLDANAISPQRAARIGQAMAAAGVDFVDGGIIGGPAWGPGETWLYLSGEQAERAAACFTAGPLQTRVIGEQPGKASALKMCFAAYTKGSTALLCAVLGAAEALGVRQELAAQWSQGGSTFAAEAGQRARRVTAKAWRFAGEMEEISATFQEAGMPGEFHAASAEIYRRLADFKGQPTPQLEAVLAALKGD